MTGPFCPKLTYDGVARESNLDQLNVFDEEVTVIASVSRLPRPS